MPAPRASEGCVGRKPGCISIPRQRRRADLQLDRVAPPLHHRSLTKSVDLSLIVRGVECSCSPRRPGIGWASATSGFVAAPLGSLPAPGSSQNFHPRKRNVNVFPDPGVLDSRNGLGHICPMPPPSVRIAVRGRV